MDRVLERPKEVMDDAGEEDLDLSPQDGPAGGLLDRLRERFDMLGVGFMDLMRSQLSLTTD